MYFHAKKASCKHFLKTSQGQGVILRLIDGAVKSAFSTTQAEVQKVHPDYVFPEKVQEYLKDDTVSTLIPWEEGFDFEAFAQPYAIAEEQVEEEGGLTEEEEEDVEGDTRETTSASPITRRAPTDSSSDKK